MAVVQVIRWMSKFPRTTMLLGSIFLRPSSTWHPTTSLKVLIGLSECCRFKHSLWEQYPGRYHLEVSSMKRVAVYVDVQNIYYTVMEKYNSHFNYSLFFEEVTANKRIVAATAYAIERGDEKQHKFQDILRRIGFTVKLLPFIKRADGSAKGDWDVGISLDIVGQAPLVDEIVLASGDGDFTSAVVKIVADHNASVSVYGVPGLTANSLIEASTLYVPIRSDLLLPIPTTW